MQKGFKCRWCYSVLPSFFCLLLPIGVLSQLLIKGTVVNKRTKEPLSYSTVGLMKQNRGTTADLNGNFVLNTHVEHDSLIVTNVGYETLKVAIGSSTGSMVIEMIEKITHLDSVTVVARKNWELTNLDGANDCGKNSLTTSGYQTQVAKLFFTTHSNSILHALSICKAHHPGEKREAIFRLRFYDFDTLRKMPGEIICNQVVEVKTKEKKVIVDLEKYRIRIPGSYFFIAVEWLKIPSNEENYKTKKNGKATEHVNYRPNIGMTLNLDDIKQQSANAMQKFWCLDYRDKWSPMLGVKYLAIAAVVKH